MKNDHSQNVQAFHKKSNRLSVYVAVAMVGALLLGNGLYYGLGKDSGFNLFLIKNILAPLGGIFLSLLKLLVVPVVFVSLVCGVASLDSLRKFGRLGLKTFLFYIATTAVAVVVALIAALIVNPGKGLSIDISGVGFETPVAPSVVQVLVGVVPDNFFTAFVQANMLQVIFISILVGLALIKMSTAGSRIVDSFKDWNELLMRLVILVMTFAPIGVFALLTKVFVEQGFSAFFPLAKYFFTVVGVLLLHLFGVYSLVLKFWGHLSPKKFFSKFRNVMAFAFSTSSSNATLPMTMETTEVELGVSNSVASFTLPLGATINMDGTAIMQGVATVFIAQVYGVDLSAMDFVIVVLMATLASIGTAGVPGVGLVTLSMVLKQVGLPVEGVGLIIGVDRLLDMLRTTVNVTGDAVVTCVVAKQEKELDIKTFNS